MSRDFSDGKRWGCYVSAAVAREVARLLEERGCRTERTGAFLEWWTS